MMNVCLFLYETVAKTVAYISGLMFVTMVGLTLRIDYVMSCYGPLPLKAPPIRDRSIHFSVSSHWLQGVLFFLYKMAVTMIRS